MSLTPCHGVQNQFSQPDKKPHTIWVFIIDLGGLVVWLESKSFVFFFEGPLCILNLF